jgi:hypothetical protein
MPAEKKEQSMSIKFILTALVLGLVPGLSMAQGCHNGMDQQDQAMTCVPGTQWDVDAGACVPVASS